MRKFLFLTILSIISLAMTAQEISESFEGATFPPSGWVSFVKSISKDFDDVYWEISDIHAHTGTKSAYSGWYDEDEEGWLVMQQYTPSTDNHTLYFFQRQFDADDDFDSEFTVRISTASQTTPSDFTIIDTQTETDFGEDWVIHEVDLSAYEGTPIYIAFVHDTNEDGDSWYIDDVRTVSLAIPGITTNPNPADNTVDLEILNSDTTRIDISWDAPSSGSTPDQYSFYMGIDESNLTKIANRVETNAHPRRFHFNTTYYWKAVSVNMAGDATGSSVWNFTTVPQPTLVAPYTITFDSIVPDGCDQMITNEDWWEYSKDPVAGTGHIGNNGDVEGTSTESGGWFAHIDDSAPNSQNTSFLTPFIDVSSLNEPKISFYLISNGEGSPNVTLTVEIWDGAAWNTMLTSNTNTAGWELKEIDLSTLTITGAIQAKFKVVEDAGDTYNDDLAIDDVKFFDGNPDGVAEIEVDNSILVFPNPVNDYVNVSSEENINKIIIYDISGKEILRFTPAKKNEKINISNFSRATYFVNIISETKNKTFKIEKN